LKTQSNTLIPLCRLKRVFIAFGGPQRAMGTPLKTQSNTLIPWCRRKRVFIAFGGPQGHADTP